MIEIKPVDESKNPKYSGITLPPEIREHISDPAETLYMGGDCCLGLTPKYKPDSAEAPKED